MKKCPYCAEQIQDDAVVCRYCKRDLRPRAPMPPPPPKRSAGKIIAAVALAAIGTVACLAFIGPLFFGGFETTRAVTYRIGGSANWATYTMTNAQGGTEQGTVAVPWEKQVSVSSGEVVALVVQNTTRSGDITCEILVDGAPFRSSRSTGQYAVVTCDGFIP